VEAGDSLATVGQRFAAKGHLLGRAMDIEGELTEFDPPRLTRLEGTTSLGSKWTWRTRFTASGTGTDIDVDYDYEISGLLAGVFDRLVIERTVERNFRTAADTFADIIQTEVLQSA
jgi:hypothetical protein